MTYLQLLPAIPSLAFIYASYSHASHRKSFRLSLIEMGLPETIARPGLVTILEGAAGGIGLMAVIANVPILQVIPICGLLALSSLLLILQPATCGCGFLELPWSLAILRNSALVLLIMAPIVVG